MKCVASSVFVGWYIDCRNMHDIVIWKRERYELARLCQNVDTSNIILKRK